MCKHHHVNFTTFSYPQKATPYPLIVTNHSHPQDTINLLAIWQMCLFWVFHINGITQYVVFCGRLSSLHVTFPRFIVLSQVISSSLFSMAKTYTAWIHHAFTELSASWWTFQCFPFFFATGNITAMNSHLQVTVKICFLFLLSICVDMELPGHMVNSILNFLRDCGTVSQRVAAPFYISTCNTLQSQFLHILANMCHDLFFF